MATRRKPPPKHVRARRSPLASGPRLPHLDLEPHQVDVLGLGLIAIGIFLSCVAYLRGAGGTVGEGAVHGLRFVFGLLGYAVPAAIVAVGAMIVLREMRPTARPLRTGAFCLVASISLALAAGTLGVGPGAPPARLFWHPAVFEARGGIVGESLLWVTSHLISTIGADILAVFMFVAGLMLVTGATVAGVLRATGTGVTGTTRIAGDAGRAIRRSTEEITVARTRRERRPAGAAATAAAAVPLPPEPLPEPLRPPEPDTEELIVRATHVEAPAVAVPEDEELAGGDAYEDEEADDDAVESHEDPGVAAHAGGPPPDPSQLTPQGRYRASVTDDPNFHWRVPTARSLTRSVGEAAKPDTAGQEQVAAQLIETLGHFGIEAKLLGRVTGPHITRYELRLAPGIKVGKVAQLKDDIAYALAATDVRILAPIPGKQAVGVEVPNARRRIVHLGDVFQAPPEDWSPLTVWLGKDVAGRAIGADLAKMPHLLVAGTTGAGKSGCVNAMLSSILLRATPHEVRLVLVDPKQVELNHYDAIPHLLTPVITSPRMAANALQNLVKEMEQRYGTMSLARTRSLPELNRFREKRGDPPLPYILCVIDELADLMMVAPADVEDSIIRLAQKARAVGIHLVLATQSPRVDVITGMIKANVPSRIAFAVSSQTDSRVILDQNGAESLLGQGDMLFSPVGTSKVQRIQGAYIDEDQIAVIAEAWRKQGEPEFHEELLEEVVGEDEGEADEDVLHPNEDPLLEEAIGLVAQMGTASTSMLQRRLRLGYTRAGRLIDMLERRSIISGYEGSKPRQVLITEADVPRILLHLAEAGPSVSPPRPPAPVEGEDVSRSGEGEAGSSGIGGAPDLA
ncbi:MAG TPA: DNA translocase FtsK [Solirubrobacteraceae bacterium]|jgi:S-DNA-T family DNA segregation ATPase FtsK/SpoIIIE|nr:DNA translocase FtsK [Solirubrobacteraceae bacterium]